MTLIAIKRIWRYQPGDRFDIDDAAGRVLILTGAAKSADDDVTSDPPRRRRTYRRLDLEAER